MSRIFPANRRTKKLARLRHDPRASFLIESGDRWVELLAVHLTGRCELLDLEKDRSLIERIDDELDVKYAKFRADHGAMPQKTQEHYAARTFIRFVPDPRVLTWDNSRMPMKGA